VQEAIFWNTPAEFSVKPTVFVMPQGGLAIRFPLPSGSG
jgi:hypothetical protein